MCPAYRSRFCFPAYALLEDVHSPARPFPLLLRPRRIQPGCAGRNGRPARASAPWPAPTVMASTERWSSSAPVPPLASGLSSALTWWRMGRRWSRCQPNERGWGSILPGNNPNSLGQPFQRSPEGRTGGGGRARAQGGTSRIAGLSGNRPRRPDSPVSRSRVPRADPPS